ncbi:Snf7-domain-containing protein [Melampsora americana]|nr:Snf7-domain-containing protein [Melampsora americana]
MTTNHHQIKSTSTSTSTTDFDSLQDYLSSLPEFQSIDRVESLYSDFLSSHQSNPAGYSINLTTWSQLIYQILRLGLQSTHSAQTSDRLVLHLDDRLLDGLRRPTIGRPYGLYIPIVSLSSNSPLTLCRLSEFLSSNRPINTTTSLPYSIVSSIFKSLLQTVAGSYFDPDQRLQQLDLNQRWETVKTDWVHLPLVSEAADLVLQRYKSSSANFSQLDRLFTLDQFKLQFTRNLFFESKKESIFSSSDTTILLRYLHRDRRVLVFDGQIVKFVAPEHLTPTGYATITPPSLTETDTGIISVRETLNQLTQQISSIESRIQLQTDQAKQYLSNSRKELASSSLRIRKSLNELLTRRLATLDTLQSVYMKIEQASSDVEIISAYETSSSTLKSLLSNPKLKIENVERTMEELQSLVADESELNEMMNEANLSINEDEIQSELEKLVKDENLDKTKDEMEMKVIEDRMKGLGVPKLEQALGEQLSPSQASDHKLLVESA